MEVIILALSHNDIIKIKVNQSEVTEYNEIIGFCHNKLHKGHLTQKLIKQHECLEKQCKYLEKYTDKPFWKHLEKKKLAKQNHKNYKKRKKELENSEKQINDELKNEFQEIADIFAPDMLITSVRRTKYPYYSIFYVSDNSYADFREYQDFITQLKLIHSNWRFHLQHIKDLNGKFITRDEYKILKKNK